MRVRMITSLSATDYDLPYGTELVVGEEMDPKRGRLDRDTAQRWLEHHVIEQVPATKDIDHEPPAAPVVRTSIIQHAETATVGGGRHRGRKR